MPATVNLHAVKTATAQFLTTSSGYDASTLKLSDGTTEINIFMSFEKATAMAAAFSTPAKAVAA